MQWSVQVWITLHGKYYLPLVPDSVSWIFVLQMLCKSCLKQDTRPKPRVSLVWIGDDHTNKQNSYYEVMYMVIVC